MTAALESRYRAALRWYPRSWRAANADAIVGTMLDQAEAEGRDVPARGELRDLASSGVGHRFELFAPRAMRDRLALIALLLGAAASLVSFVASEWAPFSPRETVYFADGGFYIPPVAGFGPFYSGAAVLYIVWLLALVAVLARQRLVSVALLALTLPYSVVLYANRPQEWAIHQPQAFALVMLGLLALVVILGDARRPLPLPRLIAAFLAALSLILLGLLTGGVYFTQGLVYGGSVFAFFEPRLLLVATLLIAGYTLYRRSAAWTAALLLSALPWLILSSLYVVPLVIVMAAAATIAVLVIVGGIWRATRSSGLASRSS